MINGIVLIDKPLEVTSTHIVSRLKKHFNCKKVGHTGTLDPLATGMLPIVLGHATKISQYLLNQSKCYQFEITLGEQRSTDDAEGEVINKQEVPFMDKSLISSLIESFKGDSLQVPPQYSALKHQGKPLYYYARQGVSIIKEARKITIHKFELLNFSPLKISFEIQCSKGTYIRSIARDIGIKLNCGAYVSQLRRLWSSPYENCPMVKLKDLQNMSKVQSLKCVLAIDTALKHLSSIVIMDDQLQAFKWGQTVIVDNLPSGEFSEMIRVYHDDQLLGLANLQEQCLKPKKLMISS